MLSVLAAVLILTANAAPFNLTCTGTMEINSALSGKEFKPYTTTYRVDPGAGVWCDGACQAQHKITDNQPGTLVLEPPRNIDTPNQHESFIGSINRETGAHNMLASSGIGPSLFYIKWTGSCEKGDFTGFPDIKGKF